MADAVIKPDSGNPLVLQDEGGSAAITVATNGNVTVAEDLTVTGDVTVTGGDVAVGADADGTDRIVTFGHATLKSVIGIDDDQDVFAINTDSAFEATNDFEIDASGNVTVGNGDITVSSGNFETSTTGKMKQKGAFLQSSVNQALFLGA